MVFSSIIFLFGFLPVVLGLYFVLPARFRNHDLLCASLFFYAWGEGVYVVLMLLSIAVNHAIAGRIGLAGRRHNGWLAAGVVFNLSLLGYFKYANFAADLAVDAGIPGLFIEPVHLPIGISFFTFQALSYLIDVHRGVSRPQASLFNTGLYIALFPQLIAGPIVRYQQIADQLVERSITLTAVHGGIVLFVIGLGKKVLLANPAGAVADDMFALPVAELSMAAAWLGVAAYSLQIYFDFCGYSEMAMGLGAMFGFRFPRNFYYPYISLSIREFWRRWHITLSSWFRDYLYIPLGGSRRGRVRTACNLVLVFALCGIWHGAALNFLFWGLYHGAFLAMERLPPVARIIRRAGLLSWFYAALVVALGWVMFRADSMAQALDFYAALFDFSGPSGTATVEFGLDRMTVAALLVGVVAATPWPGKLWTLLRTVGHRMAPGAGHAEGGALAQSLTLVFVAVVAVLCAASLASGTHNPFIYFRF